MINALTRLLRAWLERDTLSPAEAWLHAGQHLERPERLADSNARREAEGTGRQG